MIRATLLATPLLLIHGDASWIMNEPRYVWENGTTHCCGPHDCNRIARSEIQVTPDGYLVRGKLFEWDNPALYQSIDKDFWICETAGPKCLFTPEGTS